MKKYQKIRFKFILIVILALISGLLSYPKAVKFYPPLYDIVNQYRVNLGLDLQGGIRLEYEADVSNLEKNKIDEAVAGAQDVIERRVNAFGVGEPVVQIAVSGGKHRITVELPGIKDIEEAKNKIKETPFLEFKTEKNEEEIAETDTLFESMNEQSKIKGGEILEKIKSGESFEDLAMENNEDPGSKESGGDLDFVKKGQLVPEFDKVLFEENLTVGEVHPDLVETQFGWHIMKKIEERGEGDEKEVHSKHILFLKRSAAMFPDLTYKSSGLSGKDLETADVVFQSQGLSEPQVSLKFDGEGTKVFAELTKENMGKTIAIYLDGSIISAPVVQAEITNGEAVITGNFTIDEAKKLSRRLNEGALPVPLELVYQQSIEASLGQESLDTSLVAGVIGLIVVMVFMIFYYRFLGLVAAIALLIYTAIMISIFKLSGAYSPWPITLTLSGIAGFILSLGMVVDANILIFERTREELREGRGVTGAIEEGFKRAWPSIRDGNVSTIITTLILILVGTGFVKGFALILFIGVLLSMFTAIVLVRNILKFTVGEWLEDRKWLITKIRNEE
ncbi:protein translocase subunit SecD [Patescibacteria group bacterium]